MWWDEGGAGKIGRGVGDEVGWRGGGFWGQECGVVGNVGKHGVPSSPLLFDSYPDKTPVQWAHTVTNPPGHPVERGWPYPPHLTGRQKLHPLPFVDKGWPSPLAPEGGWGAY